jgi:glycogen phosphorylase
MATYTPTESISPDTARLVEQYGCGPVRFDGTDNALYERHLLFDNVVDPAIVTGKENLFLFGLTAEQVATSRGWYNPRWHYENEPETREALDLIPSDYFSRNEPGVFAPLVATLLQGDFYMHLADLKSYLDADRRLTELYANPDAWARRAILNIASSGKFSSDRTIAEYAADIWNLKPCPVS